MEIIQKRLIIFWYKFIYSESVLNYLHVYYKIKRKKQCIIGTTTIVCILFLSNKSPHLYYFFTKNTLLFLQNVFKTLLGFFLEKIPWDSYLNIYQINPEIYERLDKNGNVTSQIIKEMLPMFGKVILISK